LPPHGFAVGSPDSWPSRTYGKPLRLLFPIKRARGARGRIVFQNSLETT
jgi:hypothetical protein